jgi:hypothetical protein
MLILSIFGLIEGIRLKFTIFSYFGKLENSQTGRAHPSAAIFRAPRFRLRRHLQTADAVDTVVIGLPPPTSFCAYKA